MSNVTLVLTRQPTELFRDGAKGGRFGTMFVVVGPLVRKASFSEIRDSTLAAAQEVTVVVGENETPLYLGLEKEGSVDDLIIYDTMERFQDKNMEAHGAVKADYFMQVRPQYKVGIDYYPLTMMISSTVRDVFRKNGIPHNGAGLRVDKHGLNVRGGGAAGILVHMAPRVGFLTGCIAPGSKSVNRHAEGTSRQAMDEIFAAMGGFEPGKQARLIVLDW